MTIISKVETGHTRRQGVANKYYSYSVEIVSTEIHSQQTQNVESMFV